MDINNMLVAIDFKVNNGQIIKLGFELATQLGAKLVFLHCYHPSPEDINDEIGVVEKKHLHELIKLVDPIGNLYNKVDYGFDVIASLAVDGILNYKEEQEVDFVIVGKKNNESWIPIKSKSIVLAERIELPMLLVPEHFRMIDCSHVLFNLEFEFREIEKIYDLLLFCDKIGAILTCVHISDKKNLISSKQNMSVYDKLFEGHILQDVINFELLEKENGREIEYYAKDNEADIIVLSKTRKTWSNHYLKSKEEALSEQISIPIMLLTF